MALQTALVVDDSKLARITLQRLLQKHNLQVELAESGVHAIELLENVQPDIIFMDHLMPELDGFEATQKIKENPATSHIPVIMCTGKEGVENYDEQARGIGASGTLSKPPQPEQLAIVLAAAQSGENLVTHHKTEPPVIMHTPTQASSPSAVSTPVQSVQSSSSAQPPTDTSPPSSPASEPAQPAAAAVAGVEMEKLIGRLVALENTSSELPSFDAFENRLTASENSISSLQDALIGIKASGQEDGGVYEEKIAMLEGQLAEYQSQLETLTTAMQQTENLKSNLMQEFEALLSERIEASRQSLQTSMAAAESAKPDTREITSKVVQEVEQAITPLLEAEIKNLEGRLAVTIDDAVSESRKDLDDQLRESIKEAELKAKPIPGEPDLDNLVERIRSDIMDIATHTATSAIDVNLEDRLSEFKNQIDAARTDIQHISENAAEKADISDLLKNTQLQAMIEGTVEEMLRVQVSKQGQELVQQIAKALREQTEEKQQELTEMIERFNALEDSNNAATHRINELEEQNMVMSPSSSSSGSTGILLGGAALVTAVVALAKTFGMF